MVVWITGLSGAGKTSIASEVTRLLKLNGRPVVFLDGDHVRKFFGDDLGYSKEDRIKGAIRLARMCQWLESQDVDVVCATISFFSEVRAWNRKQIKHYFEVYVKVPLEVLIARDRKNFYQSALAGEMTDVVGVDLKLPPPENPDLVVDNSSYRHSFTEIAQNIIAAMSSLETRGHTNQHNCPAVNTANIH